MNQRFIHSFTKLLAMRTAGPMTSNPSKHKSIPAIPGELLITHLETSGDAFSNRRSICLIAQPPKWSPSPSRQEHRDIPRPTITPMNQCSHYCATFPANQMPVEPIMTGGKWVIIGPTILAKCSFGIQPVGINNAVIKPRAIKAPILGMTIAVKTTKSTDFGTSRLVFHNIILKGKMNMQRR